MYYVVVHRSSRQGSEQHGPFTSEDITLEWIGNNANRSWLGCEIVKLPGTVEAFRVELLQLAFNVGFSPKVRTRIANSILTGHAAKLAESAKLLTAIERETAEAMKKAVRDIGSCEHCPATGGGCVVCN